MMQASSARAFGSARHVQRANIPVTGSHVHHVSAVTLRSRGRLECYAQSSTATVVTAEPAAPVTTAEPVTVEQPTAVVDAASTNPSVPEPEVPKFRTVKQLRLRSAAAYLPHVNKESYGGEDAHFISNISGGAIGVADGVGGWAESGINPAEYSRTLMRVACAYIEGADTRSVATASMSGSMSSSPCASLSSADNWQIDLSTPTAVVDPRGALDTAHKLTKLPGSATACVVQLDADRKSLIAANLGDSGFIVVRDGQIALRSSPKQHFFDCPLQFGAYPEHVDGTDTADDAEIFQFSAQPGDVIIAGSDGLWDNAYNRELLELIPKNPADVDDAADRIARLARRHAADPEFASPYTAEAKAQGLDWPLWMKVMNTKIVDGKPKLGELTGGKMDDITVLVAMVEEAEITVPVTDDTTSASSSSSSSDLPKAAAASSSSDGASASTAAVAAPQAVPVAVAGAATTQSSSSSGATLNTSSSSDGAAAVVVNAQGGGVNMFIAGPAVVLGATMFVAQFFA